MCKNWLNHVLLGFGVIGLVLLLPACSETDVSIPTILTGVVNLSSNQLSPVTTVTAVAEKIKELPQASSTENPTNVIGDAIITQEESLTNSNEGICDLAGPGHPLDVSIPDGTILSPGQYFTKTWRLENLGSCPWTENYSLVWFSGSEMGTTQSVNLDTLVYPGSFVDISVDLIVPLNPGVHQSNWKLKNEDGMLFGIGPNGDFPIWISVVVTDMVTQTPEVVVDDRDIQLVVTTGEQKLFLEEALDLDNIELSSNLEGDLAFSTNQDGQPELLAINGASLVPFGMDEPDLEQCLTLQPDQTVYQVTENSNQYICYQTNLGLRGYFRAILLDLNEGYVLVNYLNWQQP